MLEAPKPREAIKAEAALIAPAAHGGGLPPSNCSIKPVSWPCTVASVEGAPVAASKLISFLALSMSTVEPLISSPASIVRASGACTVCACVICSTVRPSCARSSGDIVAASARASSLGLPVEASSVASVALTSSETLSASKVAAVIESGPLTSPATVVVLPVALSTGPICPVPSSILPAAACSSVVLTTSALVVIDVGSVNISACSSPVLGVPTVFRLEPACDRPALDFVTSIC